MKQTNDIKTAENPDFNPGDIVLYKCPHTDGVYTTIIVEHKDTDHGIFYHLSSPNSKKLFWSKSQNLTLIRSFKNQLKLEL